MMQDFIFSLELWFYTENWLKTGHTGNLIEDENSIFLS